MYLHVRGIDFTSLYYFDILFLNCSDSVVDFIYHFFYLNKMKSHFQTTKLTTLADIQQDLQEEFEDSKGEIRIRKSKNRQHNGQKKKYNRTNNDLQNIHKKVNNIPPAINSFVFKLLRSSLQSDVNADEGHTIS